MGLLINSSLQGARAQAARYWQTGGGMAGMEGILPPQHHPSDHALNLHLLTLVSTATTHRSLLQSRPDSSALRCCREKRGKSITNGARQVSTRPCKRERSCFRVPPMGRAVVRAGVSSRQHKVPLLSISLRSCKGGPTHSVPSSICTPAGEQARRVKTPRRPRLAQMHGGYTRMYGCTCTGWGPGS